MENFMFRRNCILIYLLLVVFSLSSFAQNTKTVPAGMIPPDPSIIIGKLDNGITYYIKANKKPEKRAELIIALKAGALLEDDDQKGLAHFCEHMAFNGTKNFPKNDLVNYLESTGVRFGSDLNAFTSYDRTVYMLTLPTDNADQFEKGLQVLEDWGHNVTYDDTEIDKERGVILEEWRLRKGAQDRVRKLHSPWIYYNSRYASRDIIGDTNIITKAPYDALKRFYRDWYRPDLMGIVAVGDFDPIKMEKQIKEHFSKIPARQNERKKTDYNMPSHKENFVSIATDKELTNPTIMLYFKREGRPKGTYDDLRQTMASRLFSEMFSSRLDEIRRKPNPPYIMAFAGEDDFEGNARVFRIMANCKGESFKDGIKTAFTEAYRVYQNGFTQSELDRTKKQVLRDVEQARDEEAKKESKRFAMEFVANFLDKEAIPGIEKELAFYKEWLPTITLREINALAQVFIRKENSVVTVSAPEKSEVYVPSKDEIMKIWETTYSEKIPAYVDDFVEKPLLSKQLKPGSIINEKSLPEIGVTELTLSNGIKVVLKPTDFKNDEISFSAFSPGGTSQLSDKDFYAARSADQILASSGLGEFNQTQLEKVLTGKIARVNTMISDLFENVSGSASVKDMKTMFELIYLKFTEPRKDKESFDSYINKLSSQIKGSKNSPRSVFSDTVQVTLANYNFRSKPMTEELLNEFNLDKSYEFYKNRFADASDFTFIFVGNFKPDEIKPMLTKYIANLPSINRKENWNDAGIKYPKGEVKKEVKKGIEKQATVVLTWTGDFDYTRENRFKLRSAIEVLNIKLREVLREEKGGVYGVRAMPQVKHFPRSEYVITISFGCNPDRVEELISAVSEQMKKMTENQPEETNMTKIKEIQLHEREVRLKENQFWMMGLSSYYQNNEDPNLLIQDDKLINSLTAEDVHLAAKQYFTTPNYYRFVLNPEK